MPLRGPPPRPLGAAQPDLPGALRHGVSHPCCVFIQCSSADVWLLARQRVHTGSKKRPMQPRIPQRASLRYFLLRSSLRKGLFILCETRRCHSIKTSQDSLEIPQLALHKQHIGGSTKTINCCFYPVEVGGSLWRPYKLFTKTTKMLFM